MLWLDSHPKSLQEPKVMNNSGPKNILSFVNFTVMVSAVFLGIAIFCSPDLLASVLSDDKSLNEETVLEINIWRGLLAVAGALLLVINLMWRFLPHTNQGIQRVIEDFERWENPLTRSNHRQFFGFPKSEALAWVVTIGTFLIILLSFKNSKESWFKSIGEEGGMAENLQFVLVLLAGLILSREGIVSLKARQGIVSGIGLGFGILLILVAGEEISWGQHWLGFETPESLKEINVQSEFNFHNIGSYWMNHMLAVGILVYFVCFPILGKFYKQIQYAQDRSGIPLPPLSFIPLALVAVAMDEHAVIARLWGNPPWRLSEGRELIFSACIFSASVIMMVYRKNKQDK